MYKETLLLKTDVSTYRYRSYRNCLQKIIRATRQNYLHDKCREYRQNGRKLWQLINRIIGKENNKQNSIESLKIDNLIKYDSESITNSFNDYFSNVGECLAKQQACNGLGLSNYLKGLHQYDASMFLYPTSRIEIQAVIKYLPNKGSSGYDNISNLLLKSLSDQISNPLEIIFNKSLEEGLFPTNMKKADIVPLYKSKDKQEC